MNRGRQSSDSRLSYTLVQRSGSIPGKSSLPTLCRKYNLVNRLRTMLWLFKLHLRAFRLQTIAVSKQRGSGKQKNGAASKAPPGAQSVGAPGQNRTGKASNIASAIVPLEIEELTDLSHFCHQISGFARACSNCSSVNDSSTPESGPRRAAKPSTARLTSLRKFIRISSSVSGTSSTRSAAKL